MFGINIQQHCRAFTILIFCAGLASAQAQVESDSEWAKADGDIRIRANAKSHYPSDIWRSGIGARRDAGPLAYIEMQDSYRNLRWQGEYWIMGAAKADTIAQTKQTTPCQAPLQRPVSQPTTGGHETYPESYHQGERLADEVERMRDCLSDKEVRGEFGASDVWDRINEKAAGTGKTKQSSNKPRVIKPKD